MTETKTILSEKSLLELGFEVDDSNLCGWKIRLDFETLLCVDIVEVDENFTDYCVSILQENREDLDLLYFEIETIEDLLKLYELSTGTKLN